jgi:hypothetical protein
MIACLLASHGLTLILAIGWALSEYLGENPRIKANGVYRFTRNLLHAVVFSNKKKK